MADDTASKITLISHSNVVYWWPAWLGGYALALASYVGGATITSASGDVAYIHPSNNPGLLFIGLIMLLIIFTNARLRGIYSVVTLVTIAFFAVLLAWLGWWMPSCDSSRISRRAPTWASIWCFRPHF